MQPLLASLDALLEPMAQLCVNKGIPIQAVEEHMRRAFVKAARQTCEDAGSTRLNSRISALTGLTRREVTRIEALANPARPVTRSAATDLFTRWITLPPYCGPDGPLELPRHGEAPSFDSLAASVTRDVHPRTLLETLCRLGLAETDTQQDTVRLKKHAFVPRNEWAQLVGFLGDNVGDHLRAAVVNVLGQGNEHFEQSLYADELSADSLVKARSLVAQQWQQLMTQITPRLEALMREDALAGRPQDQCLRLGMYSWMQPMAPAPTSAPTEQPTQGDCREP
ncbi:MAG: hypothetical protein EP306_00410 [Burkholderiales bacterium]|nr:MAG: hypothetical protein EP306_00410 [Burkholderiales bacterium]